MVEFIFQIIIRDTSFSSKVQKFREEVMETVITLHVELLELILCSHDLVWVFIDGLQVFNHIIRVMIQVDGFTPEVRSDMLSGLAITLTSHIGMMQLGRVIMVVVGIQLLSHQKKPVFKLRFFTISKQGRIRDLGRFVRGRLLSSLSCNMMTRVQQVSSQSVGIGVTVCRSQVQMFFKFINSFLKLGHLHSPSLSSGDSIGKTVLLNMEFIIVLLMHLQGLLIEPLQPFLTLLQELLTCDLNLLLVVLISFNQDGGTLFSSVHLESGFNRFMFIKCVLFSWFGVSWFFAFLGRASRRCTIIQSGHFPN